MKFLLATKQEMTQYFSPDGKCVAATLLSAGPIIVTEVRTKERDGYEAVQFGFGPLADLIVWGFMIVVLLVRPQGLFGSVFHGAGARA